MDALRNAGIPTSSLLQGNTTEERSLTMARESPAEIGIIEVEPITAATATAAATSEDAPILGDPSPPVVRVITAAEFRDIQTKQQQKALAEAKHEMFAILRSLAEDPGARMCTVSRYFNTIVGPWALDQTERTKNLGAIAGFGVNEALLGRDGKAQMTAALVEKGFRVGEALMRGTGAMLIVCL
jgi:hypothetical protein